MTSEETSPSVDQGNTGKQLRQARESAGLTLAQVAENQHLRPSIIQAIEEGDYRQIGSELFLKGYVRTYAGLVGLNPDKVVALLDKELEPLRREKAAAEDVNPLQDIERRKRQKARIAKGIAFILAIVVLGLLAYRFIPLSEGGAVSEPSGESGPAVEDQPSPAEEGIRIEPSEELEDLSPERGSDGDGELADIVSGADAPRADFSTESGADNGTGDGADNGEGDMAASESPGSDDVTGVSDTETGAEVDNRAQPASESQNSDMEVVAQNLFTASFSDDCWVQVTDARGRTLVAAIRRAGERISVEGTPPLRIVLGAADAVEQLEFAGESVDLSSYRAVNNRVEFTLDV